MLRTKVFKKIYDFCLNHGLGYRTLKTVIALSIVLLISYFAHFDNPLYVCVATMWAMQSTPRESIRMGGQRLIGTSIGGVLGVIMIFISKAIGIHPYILAIVGAILGFFITNVIKMKQASSFCVIIVITILIDTFELHPYIYALKKTLEAAVGIVIAVIVNYSFKRGPKQCVYKSIETQKIFWAKKKSKEQPAIVSIIETDGTPDIPESKQLEDNENIQ